MYYKSKAPYLLFLDHLSLCEKTFKKTVRNFNFCSEKGCRKNGERTFNGRPFMMFVTLKSRRRKADST